MGKNPTKAATNVICIARKHAATFNDKLNSREGASEVTGIDRTRIARIELDTLIPYPEEILLMADAYQAPQLLNHYCSELCPLGVHTVPKLELLHLDRLAIAVLSSLSQAEDIKKKIIEIVADGKITEDEVPAIERILFALEQVSKVSMEMKLWMEKNLRLETAK